MFDGWHFRSFHVCSVSYVVLGCLSLAGLQLQGLSGLVDWSESFHVQLTGEAVERSDRPNAKSRWSRSSSRSIASLAYPTPNSVSARHGAALVLRSSGDEAGDGLVMAWMRGSTELDVS